MCKARVILLAVAVMAAGTVLTGCPEDGGGLKGSWIRTLGSDTEDGTTVTLNTIYKFKSDGKLSLVNGLSFSGGDWSATVRWWANGLYSTSDGNVLMNFQGMQCQDMAAKVVINGEVPAQLPGDVGEMLHPEDLPAGWLQDVFSDLTEDPASSIPYSVDGDTLSITIGGDLLLMSRFDDEFNYADPTVDGCK